MKKIILISSGQPSLNPRLVKEADSLFNAGYDVSVIYLYWNNWGTELDKELLNQKKWETIRVGGSPSTGKWRYWYSRVIYKLANYLISKLGCKYNLAEHGIARGSIGMIRKAKSLKADLYIAHNLASLPAAVLAAEKNRVKCGFDAEDFHRQEVTDNETSIDFQLKKYIEDKYIPRLNYLTTASPMISATYKELYPLSDPQTILNVFPSERNLIIKNNKKLKLFWFSQTLGKDRGLEEVIAALVNQNNVELHLLGHYNAITKKIFNELATQSSYNLENLFYYEPIPSNEIIRFASQFDLGLATETGSPLNRDICLTNKIFTYIQAGLAVISSDTTAQKWLLEKYPDNGIVYKRADIYQLTSIILTYLSKPKLLKLHQNTSLKYAQHELNWEYEEKKFLIIIESTIGT